MLCYSCNVCFSLWSFGVERKVPRWYCLKLIKPDRMDHDHGDMSYHDSLVHCRTGHGLHLCGAHNLSMRGWERATSLARGTLAHIALLILIQHIVYICEY